MAGGNDARLRPATAGAAGAQAYCFIALMSASASMPSR